MVMKPQTGYFGQIKYDVSELVNIVPFVDLAHPVVFLKPVFCVLVIDATEERRVALPKGAGTENLVVVGVVGEGCCSSSDAMVETGGNVRLRSSRVSIPGTSTN